MRRHSRAKNSYPKKIILPIVTSLFLLVGYLIFRSPVLLIKSVLVKLDKVNCVSENQIKEQVNIIGKNFFLFNSTQIEYFLKQKFSCVKNVQVYRRFPSSVELFVSGRIPVASILEFKNMDSSSSASLATQSAQMATDSAKFLVDDEGVPFNYSNDNLNLQSIYADEVNQNYLQKTVMVINKFKSFHLDIKQVKIIGEDLYLDVGFGIVMPLRGQIEQKVAALQLILDQAKIGEEKIEMIDLRFDKPVVKYAPKK